jgi:hypothetical protein
MNLICMRAGAEWWPQARSTSVGGYPATTRNVDLSSCVFGEIKCLFLLRRRLKKWWKHGSVLWAKTCALVIHIWRVAHKWQGRSSRTRKRQSVAEIRATDTRARSNRRWRQRLSGYPSSACARGRDRRAVAKATDVASRTVPASDAVEMRGRARAWATDARHHVCRPCGVRV